MKRYVKVYYNSRGKICTSLATGDGIFLFFCFLLVPITILIEWLSSFFRDEFWVLEEDYHKKKVEELKR